MSWCDRCNVWHNYVQHPNGALEADSPCMAEQLNARMVGQPYNFPASKDRPWRIIPDEQDKSRQEEEVEGSAGVRGGSEGPLRGGSGDDSAESQGHGDGDQDGGGQTS